MLAREIETAPVPTRRDAKQEDMILGEFDAPRTWMPAGQLSLVTAIVFLLVGLIAWLR